MLRDVVAAGITPIPGSGNLPAITFDGQTVSAALGTIAVGASVTVTFRATIGAPIVGVASNTVTIGADGIASSITSNTAVARMVRTALTVTKTTTATVVRVGDRADYLIRIVAPGGSAFGATTIVDQLPAYLVFAPGTARVNGVAIAPIVAGRVLTWKLPSLAASATLTYATVVAAGASPNTTLSNLVTVTAASLALGPPGVGSASAAIQVAAAAFGNCYPITGRVYDDAKQSGRFEDGDVGLAGVRLVLDDGESVVTDTYGRYSFPCVRPGMHALRLDEQSLPVGSIPYDDRAIDSERSIRRLIHRTFDDTIVQDVNFAIAPSHAK